MNLYQHVKNMVVSSIYSGEIVDLKTLQSDWPRAFWITPQEQDFQNIGFVQEHSKYVFSIQNKFIKN